jgi:DNA-binding transcriptional ArsR family regulator
MTKDRRILYNFWDSLPALKFIDVNKKVYGKQPIRRAIVRILREGIIEDSIDQPSVRRRALNVNEIEQQLKKYFDEEDKKEGRKEEQIKITRTKLYFHLNLLEEAGMIKNVTTILQGPHKRNKTKYYGRAARSLFMTDQEMSLAKYKTRFNEYEKLAKLLGISLPQDYSKLPEKIVENDQKRYERLAHWLSRYDNLIDQNNIDISEIFEFIKYIDVLNPVHTELLSELYENFQVKLEE